MTTPYAHPQKKNEQPPPIQNQTPRVRVVVRLPFNRPHTPEAVIPNPPPVEWTPEKEQLFWKVYRQQPAERTKDWPELAKDLDVPLPYLLHRIDAKLQEEFNQLHNIKNRLNPSTSNPSQQQQHSGFPQSPVKHHGPSTRLTTPLGTRARLNSLGAATGRKIMSASTFSVGDVAPPKLTSATRLTRLRITTERDLHPSHSGELAASPTSSDGSDSEEEEITRKEEWAERTAEDQELLNKKLRDLKAMMTKDVLGLVSPAPGGMNPGLGFGGIGSPHGRGTPLQPIGSPGPGLMDRRFTGDGMSPASMGVHSPLPMTTSFRQDAPSPRNTNLNAHTAPGTRQNQSYARGNDTLSSRSMSASTNASVSSMSSPQGSIPDIPSPVSPSQSGNSPARAAYGQQPPRQQHQQKHRQQTQQQQQQQQRRQLASPRGGPGVRAVQYYRPPVDNYTNHNNNHHLSPNGDRSAHTTNTNTGMSASAAHDRFQDQDGHSSGMSGQGSAGEEEEGGSTSFSDLSDSSISASESALDSALMSNMSNHIRASAAQGSFSLNRSTGQGQGQSLAQAQGQGRDLAQMERRSHYSRSRASGR